jgi:DNA-binding MarR family transcriptional regulator
VSGLVDRLVAGGYLQRREDPGDRRQQLVTATPAGIAALDRLRELNSEALRRLITGLDARELEALLISVTALDREIQRLDELSPSRSAQPERTSA